MKQYTFEGYISTLAFSRGDYVFGYGDDEAEARKDAIENIAKKHGVPYECVRIIKRVPTITIK